MECKDYIVWRAWANLDHYILDGAVVVVWLFLCPTLRHQDRIRGARVEGVTSAV